MKSVRTEGCHVGLFREFVGTACCTYGQLNTTVVVNRRIAGVCFELHFRVTPGQFQSAAVSLDCYTVSFTATWLCEDLFSAAIRDGERSSRG